MECPPPPNGEYKGKWTSYKVEMKVDEDTVYFPTVDGVRGMDVPVKVTMTDGVAFVEVE